MVVSRASQQPRRIFARRWRELPRRSAQELCEQANVARLYAQRARLRGLSLAPLMRNFRWSVFFRLDLEATARTFAAQRAALPEIAFDDRDEPLACA